MNGLYGAARMGIRITGAIQIILGLILWPGSADALIPVHMLVGIVLVICLWVLAYGAARLGVSPVLVAVAVIWGLVTPILGVAQENLATGSAHWVVQVLHLLVGIGAIGLGEMLGGAIARTSTVTR
jgi:hypothetical protein